MEIDWGHRRGVVLVFLSVVPLLPLMLFWGAGWMWSAGISVPLAAGMAWLRHKRPGLFDSTGIEIGPGAELTTQQEISRAYLNASQSTGFG